MRFEKGIAPWILSAVLLGLSYPSFGSVIPNGILAWFAFIPILWCTQRIQSLKSLLIYSLIFNLVFLYIDVWWLAYYSFSQSAMLILSQVPLLSLPWLAFYLIHKKLGWNNALIAFPFLWTFSDYIHHLMPHGMQIYLLPYTQSNLIWLTQFIDITGMFGLGFWVAMINVALLFFIKNKTFQSALFPIFWLCLPLFYSLWIFLINPKGVIGLNNANTKVSIIQTNKDSYADQDSLHLQKVFDEVVSLCDSAVRNSEPDLLVLPEASVPINLLQNPDLLFLTRQLITNWQTPLAIGFQNIPNSTKAYEFENDAIIFIPQLAMMWDSLHLKPADIKVYQKEHGLPFVEFTPFFNEVPTIQNQKLISNKEIYTFQYQDFDNKLFRAALSICWEQLFPKKIAALVDDGAQFVALMNNDSWFGKTPGAKQLRAFTRLRAIENRRTVVRSSNGGISCFIDPFGKIYGEVPWFTSTISTEDVLCINKKSFYTKQAGWFMKTSLLIFIILWILMFLKRKQ